MTLISPGTYDAARGAVDCALTACDLVLDGEPPRRVRRVPPARSPRRRGALRRLVLPQQRRRRRAVPPRPRCGPGRDRRHRRAPRQRHAGDLLRARRRVLRLRARRSRRRAGSPTSSASRRSAATDAGTGYNRNLPLAPGTGDDEWVAGRCTTSSRRRAASPRTRSSCRSASTRPPADPESPLQITESGFAPRRPRARDARRADRLRAGGRLRPRAPSAPSSSRCCAASRPDPRSFSAGWSRPERRQPAENHRVIGSGDGPGRHRRPRDRGGRRRGRSGCGTCSCGRRGHAASSARCASRPVTSPGSPTGSAPGTRAARWTRSSGGAWPGRRRRSGSPRPRSASTRSGRRACGTTCVSVPASFAVVPVTLDDGVRLDLALRPPEARPHRRCARLLTEPSRNLRP